jgi:hypothetical protein
MPSVSCLGALAHMEREESADDRDDWAVETP